MSTVFQSQSNCHFNWFIANTLQKECGEMARPSVSIFDKGELHVHMSHDANDNNFNVELSVTVLYKSECTCYYH